MKPTTNDVQQSALKQLLIDIAAHHGGFLNAQSVVDAALPEESPLHRYFEWDDAAAAQAHRLATAEALIRRCKLTIVRPKSDAREVTVSTTRAFQSRRSQRREGGGYESIEAVMSDPDKRRELIAQVLADLLSFRRKYETLIEFEQVWAAIDALPVAEPAAGEANETATA